MSLHGIAEGMIDEASRSKSADRDLPLADIIDNHQTRSYDADVSVVRYWLSYKVPSHCKVPYDGIRLPCKRHSL